MKQVAAIKNIQHQKTIPISLKDAPSGVYMLQIHSNKKIMTKKLVVEK